MIDTPEIRLIMSNATAPGERPMSPAALTDGFTFHDLRAKSAGDDELG